LKVCVPWKRPLTRQISFILTVVGLTEIILALVRLIVLILRPGGIIERNEFGTLARWPFTKKQNSSRGE
jgi:hypothetical protein